MLHFLSHFHWLSRFSVHKPKKNHFIYRKQFYFWGSCHKVIVGHSGAIVSAHQSGPSFFAEPMTPVWLHLCQGLVSKRHKEISVLGKFPAPLRGADIYPDGFVELFGTAKRRRNCGCPHSAVH